MATSGKRFDYAYAAVNDLSVQTEQDTKNGRRKVTAVIVNEEPVQPTERFWTSLYARYGFNGSVFKYFGHDEVFDRIAQAETGRLRLCIERDDATGRHRLLAVSNPNRPVVQHDDLMPTLEQYDSQEIRYANGIVESTHVPRAGSHTFDIAGDEFSNRFVVSIPVDGFGLPNIYLSLLRHICSNGAVGYAKAFRSSLTLGRSGDDVNYSIRRALDGFGNDEGFAALRQRFDSAAKSWASVSETQDLYRHLVKLHHQQKIGGDGAATGEMTDSPDSSHSVSPDQPDETVSPILSAFHRMTGDVSRLYGLANPDALSVKRQRTLPVRCKVYDLLNFASEVATHQADDYGARSSQAWIGSVISGEYDLENSCDSFDDFQDFFLDRKLDGEAALELQHLNLSVGCRS